MKYNFQSQILDINNAPMRLPNGVEATYGDVVLTALLAHLNEPGDVKMRAYKLAQEIVKSPSAEFSIEDVAFIKERVGAVLSPIEVGRVSDFLEGKECK